MKATDETTRSTAPSTMDRYPQSGAMMAWDTMAVLM